MMEFFYALLLQVAKMKPITVLVILTITMAQTKYTESHESQNKNLTHKEATVSTTSSTFEESLLESSTFNETSTPASPPEIIPHYLTGFEIVLYIFAIIGLTFSTICLINVVRSSSYCNKTEHQNDSISRSSWRRSWRGNSRNDVILNHIIAV